MGSTIGAAREAYAAAAASSSSSYYVQQADAPWGLARLSHRDNGSQTYLYDASAGQGTCAYILDTGIYVEHDDFEGRAEVVANFVQGEDDDDLDGHGTHCTGTIGGKTYGVAKKTKLFGVKVMDGRGRGDITNILAGLDFILEDAPGRTHECPKGIVVNISLATPASTVVNEAVRALVDADIFVAVAAGNHKRDASQISPASEAAVCTVAAIDEDDEPAAFSNFGPLVDLYAPGVNILSAARAVVGEETHNAKLANGTSMASPHVAGLAAYVLGLQDEAMNPRELCAYLKSTATRDRVSHPGVNTPNLIAFNGDAVDADDGPYYRRVTRGSLGAKG